MSRRMRGLFAVLLGLSFLVAAGFAQSPETEPGWVLKKDKDGLRIFNREKEGSPIKEVLVLTTIDAPVWRLAAVVGDYDAFKDFMPYTVVSKALHQEKESPQRAVTYFFTALDLPLVSNRYYTLRLVDEWDPDGKAGAFRSAWTLSTDPAHNPAWNDPAVRDLFPKGFREPIRTPVNQGYWLFEPAGEGKTKVTYFVYTDPGGMIPPSIANQANAIAIPKLMKAVRERSQDPRYDGRAPAQ